MTEAYRLKPGDAEYMQKAAEAVRDIIPDGYGFILMVAPYGEGGLLRYISTIKREAAIEVIKYWLKKGGAEEDWMKHIK